MEAKREMDTKMMMAIVEEVDCNPETCFLDSEGNYRVLGWAANLINFSFETGKQEGRKEVVKWLQNKMYLRTTGNEVEFIQVSSAALLNDGIERVWELQISPKEWQDQCKVWGLDQKEEK